MRFSKTWVKVALSFFIFFCFVFFNLKSSDSYYTTFLTFYIVLLKPFLFVKFKLKI